MWSRVDDNIPHHPKFVRAGPIASWLWVCGNCYCNRYLTDGVIPTEMLTTLGSIPDVEAAAAKLVAAGLWEIEAGCGWRVHHFHDHNPTAADVKRKRDSDRARKREIDDSTRIPRGFHAESERNPNGIHADSTKIPEVPARAIPSHPIPSRSNGNTSVRPDGKIPAPTKAFLDWFQAEYGKRRHGAKYFVKWDAHSAIVKRLLKAHEPERLKKHAILLLTTDEEWSASTDRGIEVLAGKINWLEERLAGWEKKHAGRAPV